MQELPQTIHDPIQRLTAEGEELAAKALYKEAIGKYNEAWEMVPEPRTDWHASTWLLVAIGDSCFLAHYFVSGAEAFQYALHCPDGIGNPFIHLRLGQCQLKQKNLVEATEHLLRAYALEGREIFANEEPEYFEFLESRVKPPESGIW